MYTVSPGATPTVCVKEVHAFAQDLPFLYPVAALSTYQVAPQATCATKSKQAPRAASSFLIL
jgi:hypothetical protein